jgi:hypothetical protein
MAWHTVKHQEQFYPAFIYLDYTNFCPKSPDMSLTIITVKMSAKILTAPSHRHDALNSCHAFSVVRYSRLFQDTHRLQAAEMQVLPPTLWRPEQSQQTRPAARRRRHPLQVSDTQHLSYTPTQKHPTDIESSSPLPQTTYSRTVELSSRGRGAFILII